MDKYLVIVLGIALAIGAIAGAVYYYRRERLLHRQEQESHFRSLLIAQLKKKGASGFDFHQLVEDSEVSEAIAQEVAGKLYLSFCSKALVDAEITERDRRQMESLRAALAIPTKVASDIEARARDERYREAALHALADGHITKEEAVELEFLRNRLGLGQQRASEIMGPEAAEGYLALFRRIISDGRIVPAELEELQRYRKALALSRTEANDIVRDDVLALYRQWFCNVMQDGDVTPEEEQGFTWLKHEFGLESVDTKAYEVQLQEMKLLASYRRGQLPRVTSQKLLEGGEICHWEGSCNFQWETSTKLKSAPGELVVTSNQLAFTSPIRGFSFSPARIIDISIYNNALVIRTSSSRGSGTYFVHRPRELEAILIGLVRMHKYHTCAAYSSELSRHIPDSVRREVWHRDGGRCARCQAADYLEFDHIIPHAKGGANTVANVQLLCRRCNGLKSDRI